MISIAFYFYLFIIEICTQCRNKLEETSLLNSPPTEFAKVAIKDFSDPGEQEKSEDIAQVNNTLLTNS